MRLKNTLAPFALAIAAAVALVSASSSWAHGDPPRADFNLHRLLAEVGEATRPFIDIGNALAAGYTKFPDLSGDCVDQPGQGGMGIHYVHSALVGDAVLDPFKPEFLVYHEARHGRHELVALEYVVFAPLWDALHPQPPVLFGHPMHLVRTPNRYGTSMPFYELHVWLYEHNPNGLFNDWNPTFNCQHKR
ncbi:MAG: hypothetical protein JNJ89_08715 [Rubrivivax sp.]|nr:hypothetical protein [Rubrivivax sp.]